MTRSVIVPPDGPTAPWSSGCIMTCPPGGGGDEPARATGVALLPATGVRRRNRITGTAARSGGRAAVGGSLRPAGPGSSAAQEAQAQCPAGVVGVEVDEHHALPR